MDRKEFLKTCGMACLGTMGLSWLQSCIPSQYASSELSGNYLKVLETEFTQTQKGQPVDKKYVVVRSEQLKFPIYLAKVSDTEYTALWMECSHQGAELTAHGDYLTCPSHGSEFDRRGTVTQGPAQSNLRQFKTTVEHPYILILLS